MRVDDLEKSIKLYLQLGFKVVNRFEKPKPSAHVAVVQKDETAFELWQFNDATHPEVKIIQNHIAIYSDNLEKDVKELVNAGYKQVIPITEGVTLRYAFIQDRTGTNYEIASEKLWNLFGVRQ